MSDHDVHPNEMNEPHDFDDAATDALLSAGGSDLDPELADLLGDMRVVFTSTPPVIGAELSAFMGSTLPAPAHSPSSRRFEKMKTSLLAKIGVGVATFVAATGSLAAAHALPAPIQDAVSHLGIGTPAHHHADSPVAEDTTTTVDPTDTTMPADPSAPGDTTTTTTEPTDNHGGDVSSVAHDHSSDGCDHGATVSNVASDGQSNNDSQDASNSDSQQGPCETTTTIAGTTTPTTMDNSQTGDNQNGDSNQPSDNNQQGDSNQSGDAQDGTTPTTVDVGSTPTTAAHDGGDHQSISSGGGDSGPSGSDTNSSSDSGGGN